MEYLGFVNKIIEAEHGARDIAKDGEEQRAKSEADLKAELEQIRTDSKARADERIAKAERQINASADADIAKWDKKLAEDLARVDAVKERNMDEWVDRLFDMIVKDVK